MIIKLADKTYQIIDTDPPTRRVDDIHGVTMNALGSATSKEEAMQILHDALSAAYEEGLQSALQ